MVTSDHRGIIGKGERERAKERERLRRREGERERERGGSGLGRRRSSKLIEWKSVNRSGHISRAIKVFRDIMEHGKSADHMPEKRDNSHHIFMTILTHFAYISHLLLFQIKLGKLRCYRVIRDFSMVIFQHCFGYIHDIRNTCIYFLDVSHFHHKIITF